LSARPLAAQVPVRRILGIDPGLRVTGFGILELRGHTLVYITSGCIRATGTSLPIRLGVIARDIAHVIAEAEPAEVAIEKVFVNVNPHSTLLLGQARGAAIAAAVLAGLPVTEYTAGQVKQSVVGRGRALKAQVQEMVRRLLQLPGTPQPDAADALATAICHAHASTGTGGLARGGYRMRGGRLMSR
jgi:crossover junction endodeoxyribonuclease RuvC